MALKIVYAEDDELVRTTIAEMLRGSGATVITCATGGEAVRLCEALRPDALLLDLGMPRVDGYEAVRRIRESPTISATRVVAITGRDTAESRDEALNAGFDAFIAKPVATHALLEVLKPCDDVSVRGSDVV
jgi:CheY-like chemotaxis protein